MCFTVIKRSFFSLHQTTPKKDRIKHFGKSPHKAPQRQHPGAGQPRPPGLRAGGAPRSGGGGSRRSPVGGSRPGRGDAAAGISRGAAPGTAQASRRSPLSASARTTPPGCPRSAATSSPRGGWEVWSLPPVPLGSRPGRGSAERSGAGRPQRGGRRAERGPPAPRGGSAAPAPPVALRGAVHRPGAESPRGLRRLRRRSLPTAPRRGHGPGAQPPPPGVLSARPPAAPRRGCSSSRRSWLRGGRRQVKPFPSRPSALHPCPPSLGAAGSGVSCRAEGRRMPEARVVCRERALRGGPRGTKRCGPDVF